MNILRHCACAAAIALLTACAGMPASSGKSSMFSEQRATEHRDGDDLLTAGLGLAGVVVLAINAVWKPFVAAERSFIHRLVPARFFIW